MNISDIISQLHPSLIVIPALGVFVAFVLGFLNLSISIFLKHYKDKPWVMKYRIDSTELLVDKFEFIGHIAIIITQIGLGLALLSGIFASGNFTDAINDELLEIKIRLTLFIFFLLWTPIILKEHVSRKFKKDIYQDSPKIVPILYLLPVLISVIFTIVIIQTGLEYSSSH